MDLKNNSKSKPTPVISLSKPICAMITPNFSISTINHIFAQEAC